MMQQQFASASPFSLALSPAHVGAGLSDESNDSFAFPVSSSQQSNDSFMSVQQHLAPGGGADKVNQRRQKNRESAARSRERIKHRMFKLKLELDKTMDQKDKCSNRKKLIMNELEILEASMLAASMGKIDSPERLEQLDMDDPKQHMLLARPPVIMAPQ